MKEGWEHLESLYRGVTQTAVRSVVSDHKLSSSPNTRLRMSRISPFPTRRRSPTNAGLVSPPTSAPGYSNTRPLQIPRATTPTNGQFVSGSPQQYGLSSAPLGPLRPQRSELRGARASDYSSDRGSVASQDPYRDGVEGSQDGQAYNGYPNSANSRSRTPRQATSPYSATGDQTTPTSLNSAVSAFKSAAVRKKTLESTDDGEYWKERERDLEEEKARQQRIRERVPGLKVLKSKKGGEIDGKAPACSP